MTAATFLVFRLAPRMLTPWRSIIPSRDWRVNGELRKESPVPFRPTTRPYPTSWLVRTPSMETMSLMRDWASTALGVAARISAAEAEARRAVSNFCIRQTSC